MPKSPRQKLKLLYLYDILQKYTDENHGVSVRQIAEHLRRYGVTAERKTIYEDLSLLRDEYHADIDLCFAGPHSEYRLLSRAFELPELKLLVDAVQSSKFITRKKSDELIRKIESLTSVHEAGALHGQVYVRHRIKTMNETIYYSVDAINQAIVGNSRLRFHYFEWTPARRRVLRRGGDWYTVSPFALCWEDENYYLIALDEADHERKHFRVDKMTDLSCTGEPRENGGDFDPALYTRRVFGMYGGDDKAVRLRCDNHLAGAVFDKFGQDVMTVPDGDTFTFTADVEISPQFFGWVCGFGGGVRIEAPKEVQTQFSAYLATIAADYQA